MLGYTPLMSAVLKKEVDATRDLLEAGADPRVPHPKGRTAWDMATDSKIKNLLEKALEVDGKRGH
jgi:ankyrin repeat protein